MTETDTATAFFQVHAGYSYDPKTETPDYGRMMNARRLASAERMATARGWETETAPDDDDSADGDVDPTGIARDIASGDLVRLVVYVRDARGDIVGSLGSVIVRSETDPYVRVCAAEIALEALSPETVTLANYSEHIALEALPTVRANVFGRMVEIAAPGMVIHRGDLFHDALWLEQNVAGDRIDFYWSHDDSGTAISRDPSDPFLTSRGAVWHFLIDNDRGRWTLTTAAVDPS